MKESVGEVGPTRFVELGNEKAKFGGTKPILLLV
jgi:hypothetical protein